MKRIYYCFSCLFMIFNFTSQAQKDSTFLQNYTPPNYKFQTLAFTPNLSQSYAKTSGLKRSIFDFDLNTRYFLEKFNEKNTVTISAFMDNGLSFNTTNEINAPSSNFYSNFTNFEVNHDHFLTEPMFIGYSTDIEIRMTQSYQESSNPWSISLAVPVGLGFGRVYDVSTAWHAATIMEDAQAAGIAVDESALLGFADTLVALRYTRIFDTRLQEIERRTKLLEYLQAKAGVDMNPFASTLIIDSYQFERFTRRRRGYRIFAGPAFELTGDSRIEDGDRNWIGRFDLYPVVNFEYHRPVNKDFQLTVLLESSFKNNIDGIGQDVRVNLNTGLGWFMSRRVNFFINPGVILFQNVNEFANNSAVSVNLGAGMNYYVSPQLVLSSLLFIQRNSTSGLGFNSTAINQNFNFRAVYLLM